MKIISSQRYINEEIVAEKIADHDFEVQVSPAFEIDGEQYQIIMDGHHSFAAAIEACVQPVMIEQDSSDNDNIAILESGDIEGFMAAVQMDSDWYDVKSGKDVW